MKSLSTTFGIIILSIVITTSLAAQPFSPPLPEPGTATIDGDYGEWNLTDDYFADMYLAGKSTNQTLAKCYVRYDCTNFKLFVLVLAEPGVTLQEGAPNEHWVKIYDVKNSPLVDGNSSDFDYIYDSSNLIGWEASFGISEGNYSEFEVHANGILTASPGSTETASTGKIPLELDCGKLPVEMTSFSVSVNNSLAELQWETATEVNNYGFEVQRSLDSKNWSKVGFVNGHGNSNSPKTYSFTDESITLSGNYYYRLKQIDIDGQFEYSDMVEIDFSSSLDFKLNQNYPNPFNPTTTISYSIPRQTHTKLTVYNIFGEEITQLVNDVKEAGTYSIKFNGENLASGLYIYKLETENFVSTKKLLLLK